MFTINLKHSKTDKLCVGRPVVISQIGSNFCPFLSMSRYLRGRRGAAASDPLFVIPEGNPLSRYWFCCRLRLLCMKCGLDPDRYTAHSFRIGAATSAASKVSTATLMKMGRWTSNAFERYVRPSTADILAAQKHLGNSL